MPVESVFESPGGNAQGLLHDVSTKPATTFCNLAKAPVRSSVNGKQIIDIRQDPGEISLESEIFKGLQVPEGALKTLPTLLLYDERGLKLFEQITYLEQYYPTNEEIQVLESYSEEIAQRIPQDSIILELGSGNLRKVNILLKAIDRIGKRADYFALDLSLKELERTLAEIPTGAYQHVRCFGLHGTYDDGLVWLQSKEVKPRRKAVLSLGSSIGNFTREEAADFLRGYANALNNDDLLLVGVDQCQDADRIFHAYNDRRGVTRSFTLNGLSNANRIVGEEIFKLDKWKHVGKYDAADNRHEAFVAPTEDTYIHGIFLQKDEEIRFEQSHKYGPEALEKLWGHAGVDQVAKFSNSRGDYSLNVMAKQSYAFSRDPKVYAADTAPSWAEWTELWTLWDTVTRRMISDEELFEKPIKLRNACIFYLGHIPTFFDMKLTDTTDGILTEPKYYSKIFERGIDPDVENPEQCHDHSEVPDQWPPLDEILTYQKRVRDRVKKLYDDGSSKEMSVARCLWLGYEHECMHLETLLYMLIQSEKTLPPPGTGMPDFKGIAEEAKAMSVPNEWFDIPACDTTLGLEDPETDTGRKRHFGWDVEKPPRKVHVPAFSAKARPITNGEYALYLIQTGKEQLPSSWMETTAMNGHANGAKNGTSNASTIPDSYLVGKAVRTVYGPVSLAYAIDWPISASYDELAAYAQFMGGRIPTLEEARSIYNYVDAQKQAEKAISATIPAVNSHLVNNGVQETPPSSRTHPSASAGIGSPAAGNDPSNPHSIFADLEGCNVGFQHWHPMPVTQNGKDLSGQGGAGGLWEWTASELTEHEGYEPMKLYPAYSRDFFDGKHNIVLGGSWATAPRLAGRKTFVNWYQRNYPYVWATARVVRDL